MWLAGGRARGRALHDDVCTFRHPTPHLTHLWPFATCLAIVSAALQLCLWHHPQRRRIEVPRLPGLAG